MIRESLFQFKERLFQEKSTSDELVVGDLYNIYFIERTNDNAYISIQPGRAFEDAEEMRFVYMDNDIDGLIPIDDVVMYLGEGETHYSGIYLSTKKVLYKDRVVYVDVNMVFKRARRP